MDLTERYRRVKLLLLDVDGVLTNGDLYYGPDGEVLKQFYVRDGYGLKLWREAGYRSAIISGRRSPIVEYRAKETGIEFVKQGDDDKLAHFEEICREAGVEKQDIAFVADDTLDLVLFDKVGLAVAVADAHEDVRWAAHYITKKSGGRGAVREVIDMLLKAKSNIQKPAR
jgi:3-deoxy-D-manno-octulosonate 8-phosphate phosphatase (KDO 8-P phosphatase)